MPRLIDFLHHSIVVRFPEVPIFAGKEHLKVIPFFVLPHTYFFSHKTSPRFTVSV